MVSVDDKMCMTRCGEIRLFVLCVVWVLAFMLCVAVVVTVRF
jgi:hypothetical protein